MNKTVEVHPSLNGFLGYLVDQPWGYIGLYGVLIAATVVAATYLYRSL